MKEPRNFSAVNSDRFGSSDTGYLKINGHHATLLGQLADERTIENISRISAN